MKKVSRITRLLIILLIIVQAMSINNISNANTQLSFKFSAKSNKVKVKAGEEVKIQMQISKIDVGDIGINVIESQLKYDKQIFETIQTNQFEAQNNWVITYNEQSKKDKPNLLLSNIVAGIREDQSIGIVTLKVKPGIAPQKTRIEFKNIKSNDGEQLIKNEDIIIEIEIIEDKKENNQQVSATPNNKPILDEDRFDNIKNNEETNNETSIDNTKVDEINSNDNNTKVNEINSSDNNTEEKIEHNTVTLGEKDKINLGGGIAIATSEIPIFLIIFILLIILIVKRRKKKETNEK